MKLFRIDYSGVLFIMAEDATQAVSKAHTILNGTENGTDSIVASNASKKCVPGKWELSLPFNNQDSRSVMEILNGQ